MASYDDPRGLEEAEVMLKELFDNMNKNCVPIFIVNKSDLDESEHVFTTDEFLDLGEKYNIELCFAVSAKTDDFVEDVMYEAACHVNHFKASFLEEGLV